MEINSSEINSPPSTPADAGHPVRGAIVISLVVVAFVAALVYAVFRFAVRPQTESAPRHQRLQHVPRR